MANLIGFTGNPIEDFVGRKLSSSLEVMSVFFYQQKVLKIQYKQIKNNN